jgi:hypothetical protein
MVPCSEAAGLMRSRSACFLPTPWLPTAVAFTVVGLLALVVVGACLLALAGCGGADAPESEPREEREHPERAETAIEPPGAALDARCKKVVRETGISMELLPRRADEAFPAFSRRVQRAAGVGRVYRILYLQLRDLPGTQRQKPFEPFQRYLSAADDTAWHFEQAAGSPIRNRVELRVAFVYPAKQYSIVARLAKALDAPNCAPRPSG